MFLHIYIYINEDISFVLEFSYVSWMKTVILADPPALCCNSVLLRPPGDAPPPWIHPFFTTR